MEGYRGSDHAIRDGNANQVRCMPNMYCEEMLRAASPRKNGES